MARIRWAAVAVLATIMLAACSEGGTKAEGGSVDDPAGTSATVAESFADLAKTLDIAVPDGYMLQPDTVGDTGPTDLEKAVRDDGGDDARDVLTRARFVRGYQRMWKGAESDEVVSFVYQFADHTGAAEYTQRMAASATAPSADPAVSVATFDVAGISGATGVTSAGPTFTSSSVLFAKGPYSVEIVMTAASSNGLEALVGALAEEQASRL